MKKWLKRLWIFFPLIAAALLYFLLPFFPNVAEHVFSRGIFRILSVPIGFFTSIFPFSFTEIFVIILIPLLIFLLVRGIIRLKRAERKKTVLVRGFRKCIAAISIILCVYMLLHGVNFYRLPVSRLMSLDTSECTPEELKTVCEDLAAKMSAKRELCKEDADGHMTFSVERGKILTMAAGNYKKLYEKHPFLWGSVWRAKSVMLSHQWSYTGIAGLYFPPFVEANVNTDMPQCDIPSAAAHEVAHSRGFAREDECNFFAYLSSTSSDSVDFRYSGYLLAYVYCIGALSDYDSSMAADANKLCSDAVKRDLAQRRDYWKQFEGKLDEIAGNINNSFIESQGVKEGSLSYGMVVGLVIADYRVKGILK